MEVLHKRCAGLDVHQQTVVACARLVQRGKVAREVATFETTTKGLRALRQWLSNRRCTPVVMEATGVYWKPVWQQLEGSCELVLANPQEVRNLPGRKSDVSDAMWLADLMAHGLIRGSFVPEATVQALRELSRTRIQMSREASRHVQRIQKTLDAAGIRLTSVLSDVLGATGRAMVEALIAGESDPKALLALKRQGIKASDEQLLDALQGRLRDHQRLLLRVHLEQVDAIAQANREISRRMEELLEPFRRQLGLLKTMPGIAEATARTVVAEIGFDLSRFSTSAQLVAWAGLCPRSDQSAGKKRSTRLRPGNVWLRTALVQSAWGAVRKKDCYLRALYYRLRARRGTSKAIVAVAASMLTSIYFMLTRDQPYAELGPSHLDQRRKDRLTKQLVRRLQDLGLHVEIKSAA